MLQQMALHTLTGLVGLCAASWPKRFDDCLPSVVAALNSDDDGIGVGVYYYYYYCCCDLVIRVIISEVNEDSIVKHCSSRRFGVLLPRVLGTASWSACGASCARLHASCVGVGPESLGVFAC